MFVHFFGSLTGNTMKIGDKTNYERIVETIEYFGYKVITKHSLFKKLNEVKKETLDQHKIYVKQMIGWIKKADIVVVEVTKPEIGTGFEVSLAVQLGKPVIALYTDGQDAPILAGHFSEKVQHLEYNLDDLKETLKYALEDAKNQMDVRFNFFVSPKIVNYLNWISKIKKMPRAVYLRRLIEKDMEKQKEFKDKI